MIAVSEGVMCAMQSRWVRTLSVAWSTEYGLCQEFEINVVSIMGLRTYSIKVGHGTDCNFYRSCPTALLLLKCSALSLKNGQNHMTATLLLQLLSRSKVHRACLVVSDGSRDHDIPKLLKFCSV